jgi:FixJ family two-component response regulator
MKVPSDNKEPTVAVIDDLDVQEAIQGLLRTVDLRAQLFASVADFLGSARADLSGCLVLDVRPPGRSGLEFQDDLYFLRVPAKRTSASCASQFNCATNR